MIKAKDPQLYRIIGTEYGFLLPEGSPAQRGAMLASFSSSHQVVEAEGVRAKSKGQVAKLGQSKDQFGVFDQVDLFKNPPGDLVTPA